MTLLPPGVKVHLAFGYTDIQDSIDTLKHIVVDFDRRINRRPR